MCADRAASHWRSDVDFGAHTWREIEQLARSRTIVVIPSGAVEVYGPHLPLASDSIVAEAVARAVAARFGALCTPLIPIGNSRDLMSFPGTLTVEPTAFLAYLDGVCRSLLQWGFRDLLFLNTHAGNVSLIDQLATSLVEDSGARCLNIDWWRYCGRLGEDLLADGPWAMGHAGELCTSVLMYFADHLVKRAESTDFVPAVDPWPGGIEKYLPFREVTESGVLGRPSLADHEKGERIVERAIDAIVAEAQGHFHGSPGEGS